MCNECSKTYTTLNPDPDQVQLARYARLVERKALPTPGMLPAWLKRHFRANYVKPIVYDFRQLTPSGQLWPWKEQPFKVTQ